MIDIALWWDESASLEEKESAVWAMMKRHYKKPSHTDVDRYEPLYLNWDYVPKTQRDRLVEFILKEVKKTEQRQTIKRVESVGLA